MKRLFFTMALIVGGLLLARPLFVRVPYFRVLETIKLEQIPGEFKKKELNLKAGKFYVFDVTNIGIDHEVGFVIAPAANTDTSHHVKNAYLRKTLKDGESSQSKLVMLEAGEYVYWSALNPTPHYKITVKE